MSMFDLLPSNDEEMPPDRTCDHEDQHVVRYMQSNGVEIARVQCKTCGKGLGNKRKADYDFSNLPVFDDELREEWNKCKQEAYNAYWQRKQARWEAERQEAEQEKNEKSLIWWRNYNAYLKTPGWYKIRQAVLTRDNNLCQACLRNTATHVHHLSYDLYNQVGRSAAFELVAICRACHEQIHPHMAELQDEQTYYSPYLPKGQFGSSQDQEYAAAEALGL